VRECWCSGYSIHMGLKMSKLRSRKIKTQRVATIKSKRNTRGSNGMKAVF
jgi:hypothetical protein